MSPFPTIVFAADFSESSRHAFEVACSLARDGEARLIVAHVIDEIHVVEETVLFTELGLGGPVVGVHRDHCETLQERLREVYVPDHPVGAEFCTREGDAALEIVRLAEKKRCDLIVMGTHGRTGLRRVLMGSVAESVLRRARCAVLTVCPPSAVDTALDRLAPEKSTAS